MNGWMRPAMLCGLALALGALYGCAGMVPPPAPSSPTFAEAFVPLDPYAQIAEMKRGVNVLGYDPVWQDPSKARFQPRHFKIIHDAGFSNVRIVLQSFAHMDSDNRLDPQWLATLDTMVHAALDAGLTVSLDEHDYGFCGDDAAACKIKLDAFWSQIAPRFKDAPNRLIFELLNEPHGAMSPEVWNQQLAETLAIVRRSNPARNVVIGPSNWNGLEDLPQLQLPAGDRHIIVVVHYYHPMTFTHQGATWVGPQIRALHDVPWGSDAEIATLNKELDFVKAWSDANRRPIWLNEFGAYDKAPMQYRVIWDAAVARGAEARGFAWAYWQFDPDFKLYDFDKDAFVEPILDALIPLQTSDARE